MSVRKVLLIFFALATLALVGCGPIAPLGADNVNLIFVSTPDLAYQAPGDINPTTANLSNQGLQRSLLMATFLKQQVLGGKNVNRIYALAPMTHLQTANKYPDMAALGYIQQFALLNQIALTGSGGYGSPPFTGNSYPLVASYASGPVPSGVATPLVPCPGCQGLTFNDTAGNNKALVAGSISHHVPGLYVFAAPWETISALMSDINKQYGYGLSLPAAYPGPNDVYAITITPSKSARLVTFHADLNPPSTYPVLPSAVATNSPCTAQKPFSIAATEGINDAKIPLGINFNETAYLIRHAEAHPLSGWDDGNFVAAGQWRALALSNALRGKISPTVVYSIDPAQVLPNSYTIAGGIDFSYVRPALTVEPYAIANNLPFYLVSDLEIFDPTSPITTSAKIFSGGTLSNTTLLLAWEHNHFPPIITELLASYYPANKVPTVPAWPGGDYDTIWTVKLDAQGNLTVDNALCQGIDSSKLPATAPQY